MLWRSSCDLCTLPLLVLLPFILIHGFRQQITKFCTPHPSHPGELLESSSWETIPFGCGGLRALVGLTLGGATSCFAISISILIFLGISLSNLTSCLTCNPYCSNHQTQQQRRPSSPSLPQPDTTKLTSRRGGNGRVRFKSAHNLLTYNNHPDS